MKKVKYFIFSLICLFSCNMVFAENEFVIKSITPVYDEESSVIVTETDDKHKVIFNDKNQSVKYNVVIENTSNKDLKVESINLTSPSEDFLKYELDGLKSNDVVKANSTKEVVISLSTVKQDGWGRNFDDELTATINFVDPIANPNTGTSEVIIVILICGTLISCAFIVICRKKKITRYIVILLAFGSVITVTSAKESFVLPIKINVSYESQNVMEDAGYYNYLYGENVYNPHLFWLHNWGIKNIYFETKIIEPSDYVYKYDVSEKQNGRVMAYLVTNEKDEKYYDLFIQADGIIYANTDARYYFGEMCNLDSINNLENLDTSNVTDMSYMFYETGEYSHVFTLDLSNFDTSNVTSMMKMFYRTGYNSTNFTLDVSNFDTSNVKSMGGMFDNTGSHSEVFTLDLSNFDTSNVKSMNSMFEKTGYYSENFTLDVSGFDTSNVKSMDNMFKETGYYSKNFTLDVSNFDTSNVERMGGMFSMTGYNSTVFTLDVSNFDTSNVTGMEYMFERIGFNSTNFVLDLSNFDTSKVTNMNSMFSNAGYYSSNFALDLSNFDTSNVTSMSYMFSNTGYSSPNFTLDVSNFDTSNVKSMDNMFEGIGFNSTNFVLDLSNFDTSKVTNMYSMFLNAGYYSSNFALDLSNFDTSNVTCMDRMFEGTGYNSTKLGTSIAIRNPNTTYYGMFRDVATKSGSQIVVNYTKETETLVDEMIATKSINSNVVKGVQVD